MKICAVNIGLEDANFVSTTDIAGSAVSGDRSPGVILAGEYLDIENSMVIISPELAEHDLIVATSFLGMLNGTDISPDRPKDGNAPNIIYVAYK